MAQGNQEQARHDFTQAIKLNPEYAQAYYLRGLSHEKSGETASAFADVKKASELLPSEERFLVKLEALRAAAEERADAAPPAPTPPPEGATPNHDAPGAAGLKKPAGWIQLSRS
jgi:tetratricopeptide (TPR) repeat protein